MFGWFRSIANVLLAQPHIGRFLKDVVSNARFQFAAMSILGRKDVSPTELLSSLLMLGSITALFLSFLRKVRLAAWGWWYFCASRDKTLEKPNDIEVNYKTATRKTIVFIRHGESEWNWVFNKGPVYSRPFKLVSALIQEAFMLLQPDSIFLDSPLSSVGVQQAWDLMTFLASQPEGCQEGKSASMPCENLDIADVVSIIQGNAGNSILVSSILRRAISTGVLCLSTRLLKTQQNADRMHLMTSLQEISRNVDTLALTPARSPPQVPFKEAAMKQMGELVTFFYRTRLSYSIHQKGNKTLGMKAKDRHKEFAQYVFKQKADAIIVCGHSLWFREFFRSYLPKASTHEAKDNKMANCGVVAFDFYQGENALRVRPESIKVVYLGFEGKKKKSKAA